MKLRILGSISFLFLVALILVGAGTQIYAGESIKWKTFKEKSGFFTIKYPSNWLLGKYYEDLSAPINMYFLYQGKGSSYAQLTIYSEESLFSNITELVETQLTFLNNENYEMLQPTQCGKYIIKNISACDVFVTFEGLATEGKPTIKELIIGALDDQGFEYIIEYYGTEDLYDHFLPVAEEMIKSFNITQSTSFSHIE